MDESNLQIPTHVSKAVARLVLEIANIELTLNLIIWRLLDVPPIYGRPISARLDVRPKTEIITSLLARRKQARTQFLGFQKRLERIVALRNRVVHGAMWITSEDGKDIHFALARERAADPYVVAVVKVPLSDVIRTAGEAGKLSYDLARFSVRLKPLPRKPRRLSGKT